jgi:ubiquinone/menaquinone biosynthesis C-methylase UbiE
MEKPVLDLCCGDGYFCSLFAPTGVAAGCDFSLAALRQAHHREQYGLVACADVARGIPFQGESFQTVVSNSSLEHVKNVDVTLQEVSRVLKKGGRFYTTFASSFSYDWWPCGQQALRRYIEYQPVYNYPPIEEWQERMGKAGLHVVGHQYYLSRAATRLMVFLDYHFSRVYVTRDRTLTRPVIRLMRTIPPRLWARLWKTAFARVQIPMGERGGGILIVAERPRQ